MFLTAKLPRAGDHARIPRELAEARARFEAEGWLEKPAGYHATPPSLEAPRVCARPHARHRLRAPELRERLRAAPGRARAGALARPRREPHGARLGAAPPGAAAALARLHPRLPDGLAADRPARLPARDLPPAAGAQPAGSHAAAARSAQVRAAQRRRLPLRRPARHRARRGPGDVGSAPPARLAAGGPGGPRDRRDGLLARAATPRRCSRRWTTGSPARSPGFRSPTSRASTTATCRRCT